MVWYLRRHHWMERTMETKSGPQLRRLVFKLNTVEDLREPVARCANAQTTAAP